MGPTTTGVLVQGRKIAAPAGWTAGHPPAAALGRPNQKR